MQSPLKRILVYDLETGGFDKDFNPITEMAGVVLSTETLDIIEEFSVIFLPRLDFKSIEKNSNKASKAIFKALATKDEESNINSLRYKDRLITLKSLESLERDIEEFMSFITSRVEKLGDIGYIFNYEDYLVLQGSNFKDISKIYFDYCYSPQALEVTHMSINMLIEEGVSYEEGFEKIQELIARHTIGTNKPIRAGHNIKNFDDPFMDKLFTDNKADFYKSLNPMVIDTLEWARLRWFELSSFSLGVCANELGLTLKEAHRALPDTIANAKFLVLLLKSMRGEGSQQSTYVREKFSFSF